MSKVKGLLYLLGSKDALAVGGGSIGIQLGEVGVKTDELRLVLADLLDAESVP